MSDGENGEAPFIRPHVNITTSDAPEKENVSAAEAKTAEQPQTEEETAENRKENEKPQTPAEEPEKKPRRGLFGLFGRHS